MRTLLGQGARFALVGAAVAVVYIGVTLFLSNVAGLPFQLALALGFVTAVTTHFLLQRSFVWNRDEGYALAPQRQAGRYVVITLVQYGCTALSTSVLPDALGAETDIVYLATVACLTVTTFLLLRAHVFHPGERAT